MLRPFPSGVGAALNMPLPALNHRPRLAIVGASRGPAVPYGTIITERLDLEWAPMSGTGSFHA